MICLFFFNIVNLLQRFGEGRVFQTISILGWWYFNGYHGFVGRKMKVLIEEHDQDMLSVESK